MTATPTTGMDACCYGCGKTTDLRPYGPGGASTCFKCATSTPERKAQTERAFYANLEAAAAMSDIGSVVLSAERPPEPFMAEDIPRG